MSRIFPSIPVKLQATLAFLLLIVAGAGRSGAAQTPLDLLRKGCDSGDGSGCVKLGEAYEYESSHTPSQDEGGSVVAASRHAAAKALEAFHKACDLGQGEGCHKAAKLHDGFDGLRDIGKAVEFYGRACELKEDMGCSMLARIYEDGGYENPMNTGALIVKKDAAKAVEFRAKACDAGGEAACSELGRMYESGEGSPKDAAKSADYFLKAKKILKKYCDGEIGGSSCRKLGDLHMAGPASNPGDVAGALEAYRMACDQEEETAEGCFKLARIHDEGPHGTTDLAKAVEFYDKACGRRQAAACHNLGRMHEEGRGVAKGKGKAAKLYLKATDLMGGDCEDSMYGADCTELGDLYSASPSAILRNPDKAAEFYGKACGKRNNDGCFKLAQMYDAGGSARPDPAKALDLYTKACQMNSTGGCYRLGALYEEGGGKEFGGMAVEKNEGEAAKLFRKACAWKDANSCFRLGKMYQDGRGVANDGAKAAKSFRKACDLGSQPGCAMLGKE